MARSGKCPCGQLLVFERGPEGYKGRCPRCGAVVRLGKGKKGANKSGGVEVVGFVEMVPLAPPTPARSRKGRRLLLAAAATLAALALGASACWLIWKLARTS